MWHDMMYLRLRQHTPLHWRSKQWPLNNGFRIYPVITDQTAAWNLLDLIYRPTTDILPFLPATRVKPLGHTPSTLSELVTRSRTLTGDIKSIVPFPDSWLIDDELSAIFPFGYFLPPKNTALNNLMETVCYT